ncbi:polyprenol phosphomannose-dependent alpha 1,6 mannosyltransferase MptB [Acidipropionibacterium virtanenii]|uniref:Alpha-(1->6)-mannopyranosyltransferase A n=1 Tax=Acidipropionibacterium virtanenii TaxID=2057246 RepID=A0A344USF2_9ACTN|nr:polyprenol phosphomannose-dependent alpha 1,6 mannosyltransferase MptB [Acidipropionibacterium virtanenii]AXE38200.1 Alpha-(1->6)-mannopyranosyltransferase A [Acidipropionibacterium virtanenii]
MPLTARRRRLVEVLAVGFAGSGLMAWWAWLDEEPGHPEQLHGIQIGPWLLGLLGLVLLLTAWLRSASLKSRRGLTAACWSTPMLVTRPMLSQDSWAYAAQGWLLAHGHNPYLVAQGQAGPMAAHVDWHWSGTTAVYPPGSLWIQAAMTALAANHPYWSILAMRIPAVVAMVVIAVAVARMARMTGADPQLALWLIVTNPLVLLNIIGGAHNDGLQVAIALVALWSGWSLARARRPWLGLLAGGALVGLAGTIKQPGVLAGLGLVALVHRQVVTDGGRDTWRALVGRTLTGAVAAIAVFTGVSAIGGLGLGWLNDTAGTPASVTSDSLIAMTVQVIGWTGIPVARLVGPATTISLVLTAAAIIWCWARWGPVPGYRAAAGSRPLALQAAALAAFAICGASLQPWYLIGALAVLSLTPLTRRLTAGLVVAGVLGSGLCFLQWFSSPFLALPVAILTWLVVWLPARGHQWWESVAAAASGDPMRAGERVEAGGASGLG